MHVAHHSFAPVIVLFLLQAALQQFFAVFAFENNPYQPRHGNAVGSG